MSVVRAQQKQHDGNAEKKLLGRCVLSAIVDLLPHVEIVKGSAIKFKWDTTHVVKHEVRAKHVRHVRQRP